MKRNKSRLEYSIMNSSISTIIYVLRLVIQFVVRSFFIQYLGTKYLGLNGLFTNILSILSVAELGIGASIIFALYRPLAEGDHEKVKSLMQLYKRAYEAIGILIGVLGVAIVPFLHMIIKNSGEFSNLYVIYLLFLFNSVVSYFFTYKRSLITADQKAYVVSLNDFLFLMVANIAQIFFLVQTANFEVYLIIQIITTIVGNVTISKIVDHRYPYIKEKNIQPLPKADVTEIKHNVLGNISSKVGSVVVMGTDNILISAFVNLTAVGLYSNYTLIINAVQNLCTQVTTSITASIGNYAVTKSSADGEKLFKRHFFVNHTLVFFTAVMLMSLLNPFIQWWVGGKYNLPILTVVLIVVNYAIQVYRNSGFAFIESYGLFWYQRVKAFIEAGINLGASLIFLWVFKLGINGVLLGTIVSSFGFVIWYEAYVVYKYAIRRPLREYAILILRSMLETTVSGVCVYWLTNQIATLLGLGGFLGLILEAVICGLLTLVFYLLLYSRRSEMKYFAKILLRMVKRG